MNILFYDAKLWGNTSHRDSNSGNLLMLFLALQEAWLQRPDLLDRRFEAAWDRDGRVTVADALEILNISVGTNSVQPS